MPLTQIHIVVHIEHGPHGTCTPANGHQGVINGILEFYGITVRKHDVSVSYIRHSAQGIVQFDSLVQKIGCVEYCIALVYIIPYHFPISLKGLVIFIGTVKIMKSCFFTIGPSHGHSIGQDIFIRYSLGVIDSRSILTTGLCRRLSVGCNGTSCRCCL